MKNIFYLIACLCSLFVMSCKKEEPEIESIPPFEEREVIQELHREPAIVHYYCGDDTSFVYLRLEQDSIENLLIHSVFFLDSLFLDRHLNLRNFSGVCRPDFSYQDMHIPLLVSGEVVVLDELDTLPKSFQPFVLDSFEKVVCEVDSVHMDARIDSLTGSWSIYRFIKNDSVIYPPCEVNDLSFQFQNRRVFEYYDDYMEWHHLDGPFNGCFFGYAMDSVTSDSIYFTSGECILGWSNSTREFYQFQQYMLDFLEWRDSGVASIGMRLEDNWLILESDESRIELFKKP